MKRVPYRNKSLLQAAEGEECTIHSPLCTYRTEETVAAHYDDHWAGKGRGQKADDFAIVFACSACHMLIGGLLEFEGFNKEFYLRRGNYRTIRRLIDRGLLK